MLSDGFYAVFCSTPSRGNRNIFEGENMSEDPAQRTDAPVKEKRAPLPRSVKFTVAILFAAWIVDYIDRLVITIVLPLIGADLELNNTQLGLLASGFFFAYAFAQVPGGMLTDRFGGRPIAGVAMLTWSVFTALSGLVSSFGVLFTIRVLFGAAQAPFPSAAAKILAERTTPNQRMTAQGIVSASNGIGSLVGYLVIPPVVVLLGWRGTFIAMAGLGVLSFFLLFLLPKLNIEVPKPSAESAAARAEQWRQVRALVRNPTMMIFAAMFFGSNLITWGVVTWMPSYLQQVRGIDVGSSSLLLALPALCIAIGIYVGGRLTDKLGGASAKIVAPAMAVSLVAVILMATSESLTMFIVFECIAIFGCGLCNVPVVSVPLKALSTQLSGSAFSIVNFGGQLAGIVAPLAMGILLDSYGYTSAFLFLGIGAVLAIVMAIIAPQSVDAFARRTRLVGQEAQR